MLVVEPVQLEKRLADAEEELRERSPGKQHRGKDRYWANADIASLTGLADMRDRGDGADNAAVCVSRQAHVVLPITLKAAPHLLKLDTENPQQ